MASTDYRPQPVLKKLYDTPSCPGAWRRLRMYNTNVDHNIHSIPHSQFGKSCFGKVKFYLATQVFHASAPNRYADAIKQSTRLRVPKRDPRSSSPGAYDLGFSFFSFHRASRPTPETLTTLNRTPGISPFALPLRPKPASRTSSFSSTKLRQPSLGTEDQES